MSMRRCYDNRGFSLISVMMAAGLISIVSGAIISLQVSQQKSQAAMTFKYNSTMIRQTIISTISSDASWAMTRSKNVVMTCLSSSQMYCQPGASARSLISLYDAGGNMIVDSSDPARGFRFDGMPCDSFTPLGNNNCPLRVRVSWRAACTTPLCVGAEEFISVNFEYAPASMEQMPLNVALYNLAEQSRSRLGGQDSPSMICARGGKIFVGEGQTFNGQTADTQGCLPYSAFVGPAGQMGPAGFDGPPGPQGPSGGCVTNPGGS